MSRGTVLCIFTGHEVLSMTRKKAAITDKKINSRVQWQWVIIMDTYSLDLACQHV